jgi:four helix bundle protein
MRFFQIAIASAEECKSQLKIAGQLGAVTRDEAIRAYEDYSVVCRMLNRLIVSRKTRGDDLD